MRNGLCVIVRITVEVVTLFFFLIQLTELPRQNLFQENATAEQNDRPRPPGKPHPLPVWSLTRPPQAAELTSTCSHLLQDASKKFAPNRVCNQKYNIFTFLPKVWSLLTIHLLANVIFRGDTKFCYFGGSVSVTIYENISTSCIT